MRTSEHGVVLIIVLVFLEIYMLLSLAVLESDVFQTRMSHQYWQKKQMMFAANEVLRHAELELIHQIPPCVIPTTSSMDFAHKPLSWWQSGLSCVGNFQRLQYYYVVEALDKNACAYILQDLYGDTKKVNASYYRITLLMTTTDGLSDLHRLIQSTVSKPDTQELTCTIGSHKVNVGRQSWRELV